MKKTTLLIAFMLFIFSVGYGQTVLIPPSDGSFSTGTTFAANGWTVSNSANNPWVIGTAAASAPMTGNAAYVSNDGGASTNYTNNLPAVNYFWRDITVPAGESIIGLTFNWTGTGESNYDHWQVLTAPTTITPVGVAASSSTFSGTPVPSNIAGATSIGFGSPQTGVQTATLVLPPALAGTTFRLIFSWRDDTSGGTSPAAAIDNISLTSSTPANVISIASGNWSSPSTWNVGRVPSSSDLSITIAATHTVVSDLATPSVPVTTVAGTLNFGTASTSFTVNGNLTVNAGGAINMYNGTTGKSLSVSGNLVNNGTIDLSVGATSAGVLTLNGTAVQTINGSGTFVNNMIRNLTFSNTSTAIPNINWSFNNISVDYNLTITGAKVNLGTNKLTFGTSATSSGSTFSFTGGGFMAGGKFARWYAANGTGYTTSGPTSVSTVAAGRYPFYTPDGLQKIMYIGRTTPTAGGVYAVTYNNVAGFTTGLSIVDGAYTVTDRLNSNFVVTTEGTTPAEASLWATIFLPDAYTPTANTSRIVKQSAALSGANVTTYTAAAAQRSGVSQADLLSPTGLYLGINAVDIQFNAVASGNWNSPATWNKGVVPTCTDVVNISGGYNVTVNSAGNVAKNVVIASGATLTVASGDLVVGCTLNNNTLTNNGTLTVSGGTLTVNGNLNTVSGSTFNQSGGTIRIDGNAAGVVASSVASNTPLFNIATTNIALTGGTLIIVDPHVATTNTSAYAVYYTTGATAAGPLSSNPAHILQFGDGTSTDAGGNTSGFYLNTWASTGFISFGSIVINGGSGINRNVSSFYQLVANGDLTVNAGNTFTIATLLVNRNLTVAGNLITTTTVGTGVVTSSTSSALTFAPSTLAQVFSTTGTGTISNLATAPTANFTSLSINNTNAAGVTLANPFSVSGTLTLTAGKFVTTTANLLTLGTATAAGTLAGGSATAYVSGPFARTIASGNTNTNYVVFPVGKAAYAPVSVSPSTTGVVVMKAEAFDTNTGTFDATLLDLATNRRWEVPVVSGAASITDLNVRLGDTNLIATNIPVQAPGAAGVYTNTFGSVGVFAAGTPPTINASAALPIASYTGFLSYAKSNLCSGTPAPGNTIASANNICVGGSTVLTAQNNIPGSGLTYQWQSSTDGTNFTDITGATTTTYTATPAVPTSYRLRATCSVGPAVGFSTPVLINFANSVTNTAPGNRCGPGVVVLGATPNTGATIKWYADPTTATVLASGSSYSPSITANTTFYAASQTPTGGSRLIGNSASTSTNANNINTPYTSNYESARIQYLIRASELTDAGLLPGNLTSIAFNVTTRGTTTINQTAYTIKISNTTATQTTATTYMTGTGTTTVYGPVNLAPPALGINTYNFTTPFAWDGTSNIIVEICHDNDPTGTGGSLFGSNATVRTTPTTFNSVTGKYQDNTSLCNVETGSGSNTDLTGRPNITFGGNVPCSSLRVAVAATITPSPVFTLSATEKAICVGNTSTPVTITAGAADYTTYTWTPAAGVSGSAAAGWVFNPAVTTNYTLQASNATCNALPVTVAVIVSPYPSAIVLADAAYCDGSSSLALTPNGGTNTVAILSENFNAATNNWTKVNNSVGGTVAQAAWTLRADGYIYTSDTFHSNDNSQFYLSNSDSQAGTTETLLTSPAFSTTDFASATVSWYQYFKEVTNGSSHAGIEFSTNGTDWLESNAFELTNGTAGGFVLATAIVPQTMMNKPVVYVRFKYTGASRYYWAIDNVAITGQKSPGYTWSPAAGLYTNAAATVPYVAGTVLPRVYAKPTATTTYTITATNATGCAITATATISITSTPAPTVPSPTQNICAAGTVQDLIVTGTGVKWYTAATGGNSLFITTPLVNGTYYATQTVAGCESAARAALTVTITTVDAPTVPAATQSFCNSGTVAELLVTGNNVKWYTSANGGVALNAATALQTGTTYYASQSQGTCESTNRASVTVSISENVAPVIDVPSQTFCNSGTVAELTVTGTDVKWYTEETGGVAIEMTAALSSGTYYASQTVNGCESTARAAKTVIVTLVAAPTGDTEQEFCNAGTVAGLTATGTNIKWYAEATDGTALTSDTALENGTTYYASQTLEGCEGLTRLAVVAVVYTTVADAPQNVTVCNEYILPALENGAYYTQPNGGGTMLAAGTAVNQTTTLYVYAQQGTDIVCSAQNSFTVSVTTVPAPTGEATQTLNGDVEGDVTIEDIQFTQVLGSTVIWYPTEEDAANGTNPIAPGTVLVQGSTYYATQTIGACTSATTLAVTVDIVLGKEDFDIKAFTYHPNPVTDILNISYSSDITSVTVFNLLGQQVISRQPNATDVKIDMSGLADAAYIVNVTAGNTVKTIKVIKKQ